MDKYSNRSVINWTNDNLWAFIENMLDCFALYSCIRDENGKIIDFILEYVNDAACELSQMVKGQQLGKGLLELLPAHKNNGLFDEYCRVVETGEPFIANSFIYEDFFGSTRISKVVDLKAVKVNDGYAVSWRDITEEKRAKKALQESEEKFRNVFENATIGMALTDVNGKWVMVNRSLCEMIGYTEDEMLQMTFQEMTYPDDFKISLEYFKQALEGKISFYHIEKRFLHKDGHIVWTNLSTSIFRGKKGEPLYFSSQIQDISKIKQAAEALEYDKLKMEFFANLSHELRTPTAIILNSLQLINQYAKNNTLQTSTLNKYIGVMRQNCYRLVRLINNLIDTTKIDAGFYGLRPQNCDIVSIVESITLSVADYVGSKGIDLTFDADTEEKTIACDPDKIERIILNLLSNAVKFTKKNGKIEVIMNCKDDYISIIVRDNGIGIKKDKQKCIFERFRQADKSISRNREGSGIGLSLVKALVEMHGGEILLKSAYGHGSEFTVKLPNKKMENQNAASSLKEKKNSVDFIQRINIEFSDIYI